MTRFLAAILLMLVIASAAFAEEAPAPKDPPAAPPAAPKETPAMAPTPAAETPAPQEPPAVKPSAPPVAAPSTPSAPATPKPGRKRVQEVDPRRLEIQGQIEAPKSTFILESGTSLIPDIGSLDALLRGPLVPPIDKETFDRFVYATIEKGDRP